eukprot:m.240638 g.240638  ORF g.240638 m.240638 type:complete len:338 (-) comp33765_c3_seq1:905-1918(-)
MDRFISSGQLDNQRAARERERVAQLENAKAAHQEAEAKQQAIRRRKERTGEDVWVNPALERRLGGSDSSKRKRKEHKDSKDHKKSKSKSKKSKKDKNDKKHKKTHKKHKSKEGHRSKDDDSDDSSDDDSSDDESATAVTNTSARENWMFAGNDDPFKALTDAAHEREDKAAAREVERLKQIEIKVKPTMVPGLQPQKNKPPTVANESQDRTEPERSTSEKKGWRSKVSSQSRSNSGSDLSRHRDRRSSEISGMVRPKDEDWKKLDASHPTDSRELDFFGRDASRSNSSNNTTTDDNVKRNQDRGRDSRTNDHDRDRDTHRERDRRDRDRDRDRALIR